MASTAPPPPSQALSSGLQGLRPRKWERPGGWGFSGSRGVDDARRRAPGSCFRAISASWSRLSLPRHGQSGPRGLSSCPSAFTVHTGPWDLINSDSDPQVRGATVGGASGPHPSSTASGRPFNPSPAHPTARSFRLEPSSSPSRTHQVPEGAGHRPTAWIVSLSVSKTEAQKTAPACGRGTVGETGGHMLDPSGGHAGGGRSAILCHR